MAGTLQEEFAVCGSVCFSPVLLALKGEVTSHYHARSMSSCCVIPEIGGREHRDRVRGTSM